MTIEFKFPGVELDWEKRLHPRTKEVFLEFADASVKAGLPIAMVTSISRSQQQMVTLYTPYAMDVLKRHLTGFDLDGHEAPLSPEQVARANEILRIMEKYPHEGDLQACGRWALQRFSWHLVDTAIDARNTHYSRTQLGWVEDWFRNRLKDEPLVDGRNPWEFLVHDIGNGNHLHLGFRDTTRRNTYFSTRDANLNHFKLPAIRGEGG